MLVRAYAPWATAAVFGTEARSNAAPTTAPSSWQGMYIAPMRKHDFESGSLGPKRPPA